jgi:ribosome-associated toxin RatA of RatAB toxin-antitoxin module
LDDRVSGVRVEEQVHNRQRTADLTLEHEAVLEAVQARLDRNPDKMRVRRQTVEHPFGTIKSWMGSTHFQMKTLKHVSTEMALHVLAYNMKRLMHILGVGG